MNFGWIIPTVNTFGSVREMIEVSNVLVARGNDVTIFHPSGTRPTWLPCTASFNKLSNLKDIKLDVLIGIVDWEPDLYDLMVNHSAKIKAICLMGFNPHDSHLGSVWAGKKRARDKADRIVRDAIKNNYVIMGDGSWQNDWVREKVGIEPGPAFGGINLKMFNTNKRSYKTQSRWRLIYSGDYRERKGTDTVETALHITKDTTTYSINTAKYYGKYIDQEKLVEFYCNGDIFVDGHRRAGWCNPVIEAMACGNAVVCTNIGAVRDFAIHEETALVVPVDKPQLMANAIIRLIKDSELRKRLVKNGAHKVKEFDYEIIVSKFEDYFKERLQHG